MFFTPVGWLWVGLLVIFLVVSTYMERKAAMRGSNRSPLPEWADKALRTYFYLLVILPLCLWFPWVVSPFAVLYYPSFIDGSERTGSRKSQWFYEWRIWRFVKWYFSLKVVGEQKLENRQYIIGVHPHGFLPIGTMTALLTPVANAKEVVFNGVAPLSLAASMCFYIPIYRDFCLAAGFVDAARYNALRILNSGGTLMLVPGGATEALYCYPGKHVAYLKSRKGFIKLALETGAWLVPVYSFGEVELYGQMSASFPLIKKLQKKFQAVFGLSLPIVTNLIPRCKAITPCVGRPIPVQKVDHPTDAQVTALLEQYSRGLLEVFNKHAPDYIPNEAERKLEII